MFCLVFTDKETPEVIGPLASRTDAALLLESLLSEEAAEDLDPYSADHAWILPLESMTCEGIAGWAEDCEVWAKFNERLSERGEDDLAA